MSYPKLAWYSSQMKWTAKFSRPITLKDGRSISSLIQARDLVALIPAAHLRNAHWEYAADLIYDAARHGDTNTIGQAYEQFLRALKAEGLLR
jgi:hypothetical protein